VEEHSWNDCLEQNKARSVSSDPAKARSLLETAAARSAFVATHTIDATNANWLFEMEYASLLEALHALCIGRGFTVANHSCLGFYLRDVLRRDELFRTFDRCRYRRNGIVYYGIRMEFATAKESIDDARRISKVLHHAI